MNTSNTPWIPYKIPPTPVPEEGVTYALSFSDDANPEKNPSQFLKWKEVTFPQGTQKWDTLYWDPASGENGAWVPLLSEGSEEDIKFLRYDGDKLSWETAIPNGFRDGDLLVWYGGSWQIIPAPTDQCFLFWNGADWTTFTPPAGSGLYVLTARNGFFTWTQTEDCDT